MGARGISSEHVENMEMFSGSPLRCSPVLQLRFALVLTFVDVDKDIHCMFVEGKSRTVFFLQTLLFTAFLATVQNIITYALVST